MAPLAVAETLDCTVSTPTDTPTPTNPRPTAPIGMLTCRFSFAFTCRFPPVVRVAPASIVAPVPWIAGCAAASLAATSLAFGALAPSESAPLLAIPASRWSLFWLPRTNEWPLPEPTLLMRTRPSGRRAGGGGFVGEKGKGAVEG